MERPRSSTETAVAPPTASGNLAPTAPSAPGELMIATYNVENLFDTIDDPQTRDEEFTPSGAQAWTQEKLSRKLDNLSRVIRTMNGGRGPDILALNEVENLEVVQQLRKEGLADLGYETIAHLDTEDVRGIDCAFISRYPLLEGPELHRVHRLGQGPWGDRPTRGILEATFDVDGIPLTVFANHWPSRRGGEPWTAVLPVLLRQLLPGDRDASSGR